jgi:hypothetical protein
MNRQEVRTIRIIDPSHESYGRVAVILSEGEWYTHVRPLYSDYVHILEKEQYVVNE